MVITLNYVLKITLIYTLKSFILRVCLMGPYVTCRVIILGENKVLDSILEKDRYSSARLQSRQQNKL